MQKSAQDETGRVRTITVPLFLSGFGAKVFFVLLLIAIAAVINSVAGSAASALVKLVAIVALVIAAITVIVIGLSALWLSQDHQESAAEHYQNGLDLQSQGRYQEAIYAYALSIMNGSSPHDRESRIRSLWTERGPLHFGEMLDRELTEKNRQKAKIEENMENRREELKRQMQADATYGYQFIPDEIEDQLWPFHEELEEIERDWQMTVSGHHVTVSLINDIVENSPKT
jgi:hypothetical protein